MAVECEDCGDKTKRRTRCKLCKQLVCGWCLHHVHHAPHNPAANQKDASDPETDDTATCVCGHVRDEHGGDQEYPGSTSCTVTTDEIGKCGCVSFEGNG